MRIAFVTYEYPPFIIGGAGTYAEKVTCELAKLGHEIFVFAPQIEKLSREAVNVPNLRIIRVRINDRLPFKALQFWLSLPKVIKTAEKNGKFDIIHFNGISYWFLKKRLGSAPHIVTIHHLVTDAIKSNNLSMVSRFKNLSGENSLIIPWIEKRCIRFADKIIAVSNFTKDQILKNYNVEPGKTSVIYNGIDLNTQSFSEEDVEATKKGFVLDNKPVLLFVGRVDDPRKGLDMLIKALPKVLKKGDVNLLVVGKGDQTKARELAESIGVSNKIVFTGFVDDITLKKCYALCDVYVCPSRLEGFGLTLLDAMAAGKPIVATRVGAIPEVIRDKANGVLAEPDDENSLARAIYQALTTISDNDNFSCRILKDKFNWAKNTKILEKFYAGDISG
jgi:glycogen(starch) synthase